MAFNEKLDFLMNITQTTNSTLALNTSLDASHISRLRRGERRLARNAGYVRAMAAYFAKRCEKDYQKKALMDTLQKPAEVFEDQQMTAESLYRWLLDVRPGKSQAVAGFLDGISRFEFRRRETPVYRHAVRPKDAAGVSIHYGIEGKREAVLAFLSSVVGASEPQTLLLHSDEDMEWLTGDRVFTARWADLLAQAIARGNRIRIVHTVSRNLDEMLAALANWLPLYMTGAIEPYYYPKKRDGIFLRSLFVAPQTAAVVSTSVGTMAAKAATFLLHDKQAVDAIQEEFESYLALCRPLMRFFIPGEHMQFLETLQEFEQEEADSIMRTGGLSLVTMPTAVAQAAAARVGHDQQAALSAYYAERKRRFEASLRQNSFREIIRLTDLEAARAGKVPIASSALLGAERIYYEPTELRMHLENIVGLLQEHDNYHVQIEGRSEDTGYMLYVKEDVGAIVMKTGAPPVSFAINEANMTGAFWDFMTSKFETTQTEKAKVIRQLRKVIDDLA